MSHVQIRHVRKTYGAHVALKDVSLDIERGAFFTLLGPSGCGKTTLLRAVAGFNPQDAGEILLEGQSIGHRVPTSARSAWCSRTTPCSRT